MAGHQKILVALSLGKDDHGALLLKKALELVPAQNIHIVHIEEHPVTGLGDMTGRNHAANEAHIRQQIFPDLSALASHNQIPLDNLHIAFGDPAIEIHATVQKLGCDLLIIGHHNESRFTSLFHTTARDIVNEAATDTLVIRLP
ncbi:universal stress protein [Gilvimarinus sp. SDUM040013]|uniref:Universal stress protein n=1 Tax=Gilvimarinus gilvus TaxID=3058038 RepID=A0ABU4RTA3_9GAMM|nr:universal stress protein [Gilvimarinus sp. SDUM040013]MDO3386990.1 universal stress protein [Gilvimarinus sp. SDUM040013]MDX6848116.1 universal stress protein [Gilvimarinus sp. SDUM040013]